MALLVDIPYNLNDDIRNNCRQYSVVVKKNSAKYIVRSTV